MTRLLLTALLGGMAAWAQHTAPMPRWVATWAAPPDQAGPPMGPLTLRQTLRVSAGGSRLRIRLSNLFGRAPLRIGSACVALPAGGSAIRPGSDHAITFQGRAAVTLPPGGSVLSDPAAMDVAPLQELTVSLHLPEVVAEPTLHGVGLATAYLAPGKDAVAALQLPGASTDDSRYFLTGVEVGSQAGARVLVAFGDSITDGVGSPLDGHQRWPDQLASRLLADPASPPLAVVNAGIAGNRILHDGADPFIGPSALARFDRDALDAPGVAWVLLFEGINDITAAEILPSREDHVSAEQIIAGLKALMARAHGKGVRVLGATLLPGHVGVAGRFHHPPAAEARRQAVNAWIRSSGAFDAVVDFDRVLRDPDRPDRLRPAYASRDQVHPNAEGYRAMAEAIDARLFR